MLLGLGNVRSPGPQPSLKKQPVNTSQCNANSQRVQKQTPQSAPQPITGCTQTKTVNDPTFAKNLESASVHPTAEIGPNVTIAAGARVGAGVRIAAGCSLGTDIAIGDHTVLHPNVTLYHRVTIGSRCILHSGAVIGADGFGFEMAGGQYHKVPQVGTVLIGDDVEIGANTCIDRATLGETVIGDGTKLDNMVHIAHNCRIGRHVVIAAQTGLAGGVTIGDYAVVGGQVGVGDKARIESGAIIGSGAGILTVWGTPARPLRRYLAQLAAVSKLALKHSPVSADISVHDGTDT